MEPTTIERRWKVPHQELTEDIRSVLAAPDRRPGRAPVLSGTSVESVQPILGSKPVIAASAFDAVSVSAAGQHVVAILTRDVVAAWSCFHEVGSFACLDPVCAGARRDDVAACAAAYHVRTVADRHVVSAGTSSRLCAPTEGDIYLVAPFPPVDAQRSGRNSVVHHHAYVVTAVSRVDSEAPSLRWRARQVDLDRVLTAARMDQIRTIVQVRIRDADQIVTFGSTCSIGALRTSAVRVGGWGRRRWGSRW